ncbi:Inactive TPR repeat-containing thioredoxin [Nymphaea thermarum]|nr:Inactive TPR repeat-containing thioredoxin [Nymphaea thermarum]
MNAAETDAEACEPESSRYGCNIFRSVFGRRRTSSSRSPIAGGVGVSKEKGSHLSISRRRKAGSDEASFLAQDPSGPTLSPSNALVQVMPGSNALATIHGNDNLRAVVPKSANMNQLVPRNPTTDVVQGRPPATADGNITLMRASSKVMVLGHLGNLRQAATPTYNDSDLHNYQKSKNGNSNNKNQRGQKANPAAYAAATAAAEAVSPQRKKYGMMQDNSGNNNNNSLVQNNNNVDRAGGENQPGEAVGALSRALSKRLNPEELKEAGNEEYKNGRFAEALALYDRAIVLDPTCASYHSNKSAALIGLGRLLDAVSECKEAIRLEPTYTRAHHRLATLYFRLGVTDKSLFHYKQAGNETNPKEIKQVQALQTLLTKCTEARKSRDYQTLLKETAAAIDDGADAAPLLFASQAEALLRLHRHEEADKALSSGPQFAVEAATEFFGAASNACMLLIRAQVDLASGRFENAVSSAQLAATLDPSNKEIALFARKAQTVAATRLNGNELFKSSNFHEACAAYSEGLEHEPMNAILLCNRAACRSKLRQLEKAIEDCNASLKLRPNYSKARLRRADCNAKLGRWEASIKDYEALLKESPDDAELLEGLADAKQQLEKQAVATGEKPTEEDGSQEPDDLIVISNADDYREFVRSPAGLYVAFFCSKSSEPSKQILPFVQQLSKRHQSIHFLKVDIEESPVLAKWERVSSVPAFKIYKNGNKVKDIAGANQQLLESSVKFFSS